MPDQRHSSFQQLLTEALAGIARLSEAQLGQLASHYDLLSRWNARMNLTAIRSLEEAVVRHYAESIFLGTVITGGRVLDIGSGAGFPGLPIAVCHPEWHVTVVESHQRKAVFLREAARDLPNVSVTPRRAEEVTGNWDWVVSRAVRPDVVVIASMPLAASTALLMTSDDLQDLPTSLQWERPVPLPWGDRRIAVIGHVQR